ncbi:MAG TPA: phosphatase PAP2 family protein [Longimicrobiales bacterium]|nr:phosphatase PAP2 family protein [Longimicrobiales bacterium]
MTAPGGPVLGLPLDRLFALYLAVAAVALLFPHRPGAWPVLLALHVLAIAVAWPMPPIQHSLAGARPGIRRVIRGTADWLPLLLIPLLYTELAVLNRAVHDGRYFDTMIIAWEQLLFRSQPSQEWAAAAPYLWLSEPLHAAYLSYYFIIFGPPLLLFLRGRTDAFRRVAFAVMLSFFAHYLFFIYFPVQGPRYLFPAPGGELAAGPFYQVAHRVLEAGSAQGAAFPSSHVGVSVTMTLMVIRHLPRLAPLIGALTAGLAFGAIYGGFHYAIDAVAGLILGAFVWLAARPLYDRLLSQSRGLSVPAAP